MDDYPVIFSGSHPSNESGEYIWPPQFCDSASSMHPDLSLEDLVFPLSECPAKCIDNANGLESADKKWLHKVIERERRKDMRSRYSALRSLLPEENDRGKSTISDQLSEAADYIRCLQVEVEELTNKREDMKNMNLESKSYKKHKVYIALPGQIVLSKLLLMVEEGGLQVLNATSFATGDNVFYTVQCKVSDANSFTRCTELRQKLWKLIG